MQQISYMTVLDLHAKATAHYTDAQQIYFRMRCSVYASHSRARI